MGDMKVEKKRATIASHLECPATTICSPKGSFIMVVDCETGKIVYATESVKTALRQYKNSFVGAYVQNVVKGTDVSRVQRELEVSGDSCERNFVSHMKLGNAPPVESLKDAHQLLAAHGAAGFALTHVYGTIQEYNGVPCLVAVCNVKETSNPKLETTGTCNNLFLSQLTRDGYFVAGAKEVFSNLGYHPRDLLNKPIYEFMHPEDVPVVKKHFQREFANQGRFASVRYRAKAVVEEGCKTRVEYIYVNADTYVDVNPNDELLLHLFVNALYPNKPSSTSSGRPTEAGFGIVPETAVAVKSNPPQAAKSGRAGRRGPTTFEFLLNTAGVVQECDSYVYPLLGYKSEEFKGDLLFPYIRTEDERKMHEIFGKVLTGESSGEIARLSILNRLNEPQPMELSLRPYTVNGKVKNVHAEADIFLD